MLINEILKLDLGDKLREVTCGEGEEFACEMEDVLVEGQVVRQVRRYGDKLKNQYRCQGGDKDGRLVASPSECGIRKDPNRVRAGQRSARLKKGERVRKTKFTKRKTLSQILVRRNKMLKGSTADKVTQNNREIKSDNITTKSGKGTE